MLESMDLEKAHSLAKQAIRLMEEHRVPPNPENYSIWFRYASRAVGQLNRVIDVLISNKQTFDEATNGDLVRLFLLSDAQKVPDTVLSVLDEARGLLSRAIADQRSHVERLEGVSGDPEQSDPKLLLDTLVGELLKATSRASSLERSLGQTCGELEQIKIKLAQADQQARIDPLTGLANRRGLEEGLRSAQLTAMSEGQPLSIVMIDVDHFKRFNDAYGHQTGDQVLKLTATVFKGQLRDIDLSGRYGGEEMMGVLTGADLDMARGIAERIRIKVAARKLSRRSTGEDLGRITVSIGVAEFRPGEAMSALVERADRALYAAKSDGRNRTATELDVDGKFAA